MIYDIKCLNFLFKVQNHDTDVSINPQLKQGVYEPHVQSMMELVVNKDMKCLDIGANIGIHSLLLHNLSDRVECIEGSVDNINLLNKNFELNSFTPPKTYNVFLGDGKPVTFSYTDDYHACAYTSTTNFKRNSSADINSGLPEHTTKVINTQKLSNIIDYIPDFIKIDIEGAELNTILSSLAIFRDTKFMIIELNKWTNEAFFNQPIKNLTDLLYTMYDLYLYYNNTIHKVDKDWLDNFFKTNLMLDVLCINRNINKTT